MTTNRQRKRDQRKRDQRAREKAARAERRRDPERPDRQTVCEQYGRPITRESIEDEMRRRGLLR